MENKEESMNEVSEQDENVSYIDISGDVQDCTEVLIGEVQKRPALYNTKSSIQSRNRVIVNKMRQEIFEIFEGKYKKYNKSMSKSYEQFALIFHLFQLYFIIFFQEMCLFVY